MAQWLSTFVQKPWFPGFKSHLDEKFFRQSELRLKSAVLFRSACVVKYCSHTTYLASQSMFSIPPTVPLSWWFGWHCSTSKPKHVLYSTYKHWWFGWWLCWTSTWSAKTSAPICLLNPACVRDKLPAPDKSPTRSKKLVMRVLSTLTLRSQAGVK